MTADFIFPRFDGDALCATTDPEAFFPEKGKSLREARHTCERCEIQPDCLAWALANNEHGVWGGTSEEQRKNIRRDLAKHKPRPGKRPLKPINHGTTAGAKAHRRRKEPLCPQCAAAASAAYRAKAPQDTCPVCGVVMLKRSVAKHVQRRHPDAGEAA